MCPTKYTQKGYIAFIITIGVVGVGRPSDALSEKKPAWVGFELTPGALVRNKWQIVTAQIVTENLTDLEKNRNQ